MPGKYVVGQKLWFVESDNRSRYGDRSGIEVTIERAGNKWAYFTRYKGHIPMRVEHGSLDVDGGQYSSPGSVYLSKEDYVQRLALSKAWEDFLRDLRGLQYRKRPVDVTVEDIELARELLKLPPAGGKEE